MRTSRIPLLAAAVAGFSISGAMVARAVDAEESDRPEAFRRFSAVGAAFGGQTPNLDRLRLTAADLARHGPGPVLDRTSANGDRLLVWTE